MSDKEQQTANVSDSDADVVSASTSANVDANATANVETNANATADADAEGDDDSVVEIPFKPPTNDYVLIKAIGQDKSEVHFRINSDTILIKLKMFYAQRTRLRTTMLHFIYDGRHVKDTDTARILKMEDNDVIEVYVARRTGG